ncbi:MAG: CRISPR-associated endoribonuclease Cas13a, partial [Paludibacter sp.]|nr:CRISPR-associated endoribonuclease Cas13a [Paludibacter sp.]
MRVTKVKVKDGGKDKMVLIHRKTTGAQLVYSGQAVSNETHKILPEKKRDSFDLSILNKTLIKFETVKKQKLNIDQYKIVEKIFKYPKEELPSQIKAEEVLPFLNHKFQEPVKYWKDGKPESFNLTLLIVESVKAQDKRKLQPYYDWKAWYINTKSDLLKKSIENNRIDLTENLSKRKKALLAWENDFTTQGNIDLTHFHKVYMTDVLCKMLQEVKPLTDDKGKINSNAYHRGLKKALQTHQPAIFGTREAPNEANRANEQLSIYHLEVVKYLEHYFPIKTSKRRNTADDIAHYLK